MTSRISDFSQNNFDKSKEVIFDSNLRFTDILGKQLSSPILRHVPLNAPQILSDPKIINANPI